MASGWRRCPRTQPRLGNGNPPRTHNREPTPETTACGAERFADVVACLTSSAREQKPDWAKFEAAWEEVASENVWIEMREYQPGVPYPFCTLCSRWAQDTHVGSRRCLGRVRDAGYQHGPILSAIICIGANKMDGQWKARWGEGQRTGLIRHTRLVLAHLTPHVL